MVVVGRKADAVGCGFAGGGRTKSSSLNGDKVQSALPGHTCSGVRERKPNRPCVEVSCFCVLVLVLTLSPLRLEDAPQHTKTCEANPVGDVFVVFRCVRESWGVGAGWEHGLGGSLFSSGSEAQLARYFISFSFIFQLMSSVWGWEVRLKG